MKYQDVITALKQPENLNESYIGIFLNPETAYFGFYQIDIPDKDDPEWISVWYEGSKLFDDLGEEGAYSLDDVPEEATQLFYKNAEGMPSFLGDKSEYVLYALFPDLPDPEDVWERYERKEFMRLALERVNTVWVQS